MAPAAGCGDVGVIHRRLGIVGGQNLVCAPVAVLAIGRGRRAALGSLGMQAVGVRFLGIRVALGAGDLLRGALMRQALHVGVAIHAAEHRAVNRMLELVRVHAQADRLAIHLCHEGGVGVAGKAVAVLELMLGMSRARPDQQGQGKRLSEDSSGGVHDLEETLCAQEPAVTEITVRKPARLRLRLRSF